MVILLCSFPTKNHKISKILRQLLMCLNVLRSKYLLQTFETNHIPCKSTYSTYIIYSHLSNNCGGWNKRVGVQKM